MMPRAAHWGVGALALGLCVIMSAGGPPLRAESTGAIAIPVEGKPARMISEYNLFRDPQRQIPNAGLLPYDMNTPLFTDYAAKHRFVWMPAGTSAQYSADEAFEFPVGTVLVKTFSYPLDGANPAAGERLIETRLLIRQTDGWKALPYIWNEEGTDARLAVAGGRIPLTWKQADGTERSTNYLVPNMNQCKECHANKDVIGPIGPKSRHLNKTYPYDTGVANQLSHWSEVGYLHGAPADPAQTLALPAAFDPTSGTLDHRARAWLDINCAHCHNPNGPAYTSGLDLSWAQQDMARVGLLKPPVAAGRGSAGLQFGIDPGKPDRSILLSRISSHELGVMMPPLGRTMEDDDGVALIAEWIAAMPAAQ